MSLYTDTDLSKIICSTEEWKGQDTLYIFPFSSDSLTPVGYDLRVGNFYSSKLQGGPFPLKLGEKLTIRPGDTVLIATLEDIGMPRTRSLSGFILSKVSKVSKGLSHVATTLDPDWGGNLLIAMNNHSKDDVQLEYGEPFCTAVFLENKSVSTKPCGKSPNRIEILIDEWSKASKRARRIGMLFSLLTLSIIPIFSFVGYLIFGNNPGFVAATALGVAISQAIFYLRKG